LTLYRSIVLMTLFALYGVGFAMDLTYHCPLVENLNVVAARPSAAAVTVRGSRTQVEPLSR
jgi:hypothetical protein